MIVLDFWTRQSTEETLARCLSTDVSLILCPLDSSEGNFSCFRRNVDKLMDMGLAKPASGPFFLKCKHLTASMDKCHGIQETGLMPLNALLTNDSYLRRFLLGKGITVDLDSMALRYSKGNRVIPLSKENSMISDKAPIQMLRRRFETDDGITTFLTEESIDSYYADLAFAPEILSTIEQVLCLPNGELTNPWRKMTNPYLATICAPLSEYDSDTFQEHVFVLSEQDASQAFIDPIESTFNFVFQRRGSRYAYFRSNRTVEAKWINCIEPFSQK